MVTFQLNRLAKITRSLTFNKILYDFIMNYFQFSVVRFSENITSTGAALVIVVEFDSYFHKHSNGVADRLVNYMLW